MAERLNIARRSEGEFSFKAVEGLDQRIRAVRGIGTVRGERVDRTEVDLGKVDAVVHENFLLEMGWKALTDDLPLVLLPIRLETRFRRSGQNKTELLIRIYPDDIHVQDHQVGLSKDEYALAEVFWRDLWCAGNDEDRQRFAWAELVQALDAPRALYVKQLTTPINADLAPSLPTAPDSELTVQPELPSLQLAESRWRTAAKAAAMPERWIAVGYGKGGERLPPAFGRVIPDSLAVGPDPEADDTNADEPDASAVFDNGMKWLTDFDVAEAVGMAIRLPVNEKYLADGLERLFVFGVATDLSPQESVDELSRLLESHKFSTGVRFAERGEPTNNTGENLRKSRAAMARDEFAVACQPAPVQRGDGSDADLLAKALGLPTSLLGDVIGAKDNSEKRTQDMMTVLWPAGFGGFLSQQLELDKTGSIVSAVKEFAFENVRPGGPFAPLIIGQQPYGFLPVSIVDVHNDLSDSADVRVSSVVEMLRPMWTKAADKEAKAQPDVWSKLSKSAVTRAWYRRFSTHIDKGLDGDHPSIGSALVRALIQNQANALSALGISKDSVLAERLFYLAAERVALPLMPEDTSEISAWLKVNALDAIGTDDTPGSLFEIFVQLGQFMLAGSAIAAAIGTARVPDIDVNASRQSLQSALRGQSTPAQIAEIFGRNAASRRFVATSSQWERRRYLPQESELQQFRDSLRRLCKIPADELERVFCETLDLGVHRLDAWSTALATKRLKSQRANQPSGLHIGGYGWLENLKPADTANSGYANPNTPKTPPGNAGFIHAPSINQAKTAAILMSAQRSNPDARFDIDLSSGRVRKALHLLDGIRQGQTLQALLGYQFERQLQALPDKSLMAYLPALRDAYSTRQDAPKETRISHVVDGEALIENRDKISWGKDGLPPAGSSESQAITSLIDEIAQSLDAVADLTVAEGVHQVQSGNFDRAAAALNTVARGETPLPEMDVISTRRRGTVITQKVGIVLQNQKLPEGWSAKPWHVRSVAEPRLNAWVGNLIGDPAHFTCQTHWRSKDNLRIDGTKRLIRLTELELCPLDVVAMSLPESRPEFEDRIAALVGQSPQPDCTLEIQFSKSGQANSFADLIKLGADIWRCLSAGRPMTSRDLDIADMASVNSVDAGELAQRYARLETQYQRAMDLLSSEASDENAKLDALRTLSGFGLTEAHEALARKVDLQAVISAAGSMNWAKPKPKPDAMADALKSGFGGAFPILPLVSLDSGQQSALQPSLGANLAAPDMSQNTKIAESHAVTSWLPKIRQAREPMDYLAAAIDAAEIVNYHELDGIWHIIQYPFEPNQRWIGLSAKGLPPTTSLLLHSFDPLDLSEPIAGVLIDEWSSALPADDQVTGAAFHFDAPDAVAPQAVLLAVTPKDRDEWSTALLEAILNETYESIRTRSVGLDKILKENNGLNGLLPAIYLPIDEEVREGALGPDALDGKDAP
ncbi:hypothetical protein [Hyphobacterium sp.]|uniref:hypothetical protein n=1 Tax=Hyphobacterium sp. TaxID=2004662 RepID=UPI003BABAEB1